MLHHLLEVVLRELVCYPQQVPAGVSVKLSSHWSIHHVELSCDWSMLPASVSVSKCSDSETIARVQLPLQELTANILQTVEF